MKEGENSDRQAQKYKIYLQINSEANIYLFATWFISLGLAYRDDSPGLFAPFSPGMSYIIWLKVDGFTSLFIVVYCLLFPLLMSIQNYRQIFVVAKIVMMLFKIACVVVGMTIFFKMNSHDISNVLLIFSLLYYSIFLFMIPRLLSSCSNLIAGTLEQKEQGTLRKQTEDNNRIDSSKEIITAESKAIKYRESTSSGKNVLQQLSRDRKKISQLEKEELGGSLEKVRDTIRNLQLLLNDLQPRINEDNRQNQPEVSQIDIKTDLEKEERKVGVSNAASARTYISMVKSLQKNHGMSDSSSNRDVSVSNMSALAPNKMPYGAVTELKPIEQDKKQSSFAEDKSNLEGANSGSISKTQSNQIKKSPQNNYNGIQINVISFEKKQQEP